jgi:hypothetical protein
MKHLLAIGGLITKLLVVIGEEIDKKPIEEKNGECQRESHFGKDPYPLVTQGIGDFGYGGHIQHIPDEHMSSNLFLRECSFLCKLGVLFFNF